MSIPKIGPSGEATALEEPSPAARMELERNLRRLGETLNERTDEVVGGIAGATRNPA